MKTKKDLIPGKRYRGWGTLNEYGEFVFEPEETGSKAGVVKQILSRDDITLSHTSKYVLIRLKLMKTDQKSELIASLMKKYNEITSILLQYEF